MPNIDFLQAPVLLPPLTPHPPESKAEEDVDEKRYLSKRLLFLLFEPI